MALININLLRSLKTPSHYRLGMTHKGQNRRLVAANKKLAEKHHKSFARSVKKNGVKVAAQNFGVSLATAYRWAKRQPQKCGRKPLGKPESLLIRKRLAEIADRREVDGDEEYVPFPSFISISKQYGIEYGQTVGRRRVAALLSLEGYRPIVRPKHPALDNREARKKFAEYWKDRSPNKIVFSDEHFVSTNASTTHKMIVKKGARPVPKSSKRRQNIPNFQIWAAIGHNYKSPIVIFPIRKSAKADDDDDGKQNFRLNAKGYTRRCLPRVKAHLQKRGIIFMQDGASCHRARSVMDYLKRNGITVMKGFPASSPDLNPIESVWALLNRLIYEMRPKTVAELRAATVKAWESIPQKTINNYIARFRTDVKRVFDNDGV